ncbi:hypothetical protein J5893_01985 [bacterium]|nr:hypothetical protein [bacterium]
MSEKFNKKGEETYNKKEKEVVYSLFVSPKSWEGSRIEMVQNLEKLYSLADEYKLTYNCNFYGTKFYGSEEDLTNFKNIARKDADIHANFELRNRVHLIDMDQEDSKEVMEFHVAKAVMKDMENRKNMLGVLPNNTICRRLSNLNALYGVADKYHLIHESMLENEEFYGKEEDVKNFKNAAERALNLGSKFFLDSRITHVKLARVNAIKTAIKAGRDYMLTLPDKDEMVKFFPGKGTASDMQKIYKKADEFQLYYRSGCNDRKFYGKKQALMSFLNTILIDDVGSTIDLADKWIMPSDWYISEKAQKKIKEDQEKRKMACNLTKKCKEKGSENEK